MNKSPTISAPEGIRPNAIISLAIATTGVKYVTEAMRVAPQRLISATISKNATAEENTPALIMDSTTLAVNA